MWIAYSQKCLRGGDCSREHSCYLFSPGVWFLMFVEETGIPFFRIDMGIQKVLMSILVTNGISVQLFLETLGRMLRGEALEIPQNDKMLKARCSMGLPLCFLLWNFTAIGRERSDCSYNRAEREMSSMEDPSSLWAECRKIIEKISETFKNHKHNMFFK